jgi:transcriptional regulatory protein LEU3
MRLLTLLTNIVDYDKEAKETLRPQQPSRPHTASGTPVPTKFDPISLHNQNQPQMQNQLQGRHPQLMQQQMPPVPTHNAAAMSFDTWDGGSDYGYQQPMLDQFPDYDWAASFDFSSEWPTVPMQIPGPGPGPGQGPVEGYRAPAGYQFG